MSGFSPFQLLEINLISAQDISKVSRSMRTYAVAWVHPDRKLTTRVDTHGGTNPTWNDKFVFRVDNQFLKSDTSAIMIEIYALHWFKDVYVGTVRVLVGNLIPPQTRSHNQSHIGMRFVALQVRRPSGRPQGILNVGVTVLDSTMRSMPLYTQLSTSALGYQKLMGQHDLHSHKPGETSTNMGSTAVQLRRTKSEKSSVFGFNKGGRLSIAEDIDDNNQTDSFILPKPNNSIINGSDTSSMVGKKGNTNNKVIYDKPLSIVDGVDATSNLSLAVKLKAQEGKAESTLSHGGGKRGNRKKLSNSSRSDIGVAKSKEHEWRTMKKADSDIGGMIPEKNKASKPKHNWLPQIDNNNNKKNKKHDRNTYSHKGYPIMKDFAAGSVWSESEVGPSPSEVAAAIAEDSKYRQFDDGRSSMLDDKWSLDESEGVRTKLERWRTEMPPLYDYSRTDSISSTIFPAKKHNRRHTDGGGKFSCFSNICGLECTIVCGKGGSGNNTKNAKKGSSANKIARAPSMDSVSTYF